MRRAHCLPIALLAATTLAGAAVAQTAQPTVRQDLRQISWPGRNTTASAPAATATATTRPDLRRSNLVIPHGGFAAVESAPVAPAAVAPRRTLTPANAWLQPAPEPAPAPSPAPAPAPAPAPPPAMTAPSPAAVPASTPEYLPDQGRRGQGAPADIVYAAPPRPMPEAAPDQPADPMAPRRDAPIFRMQQATPTAEPAAQAAEAPPRQEQAGPPRPRYVAEVTNTGERPPQQGARYYSVHRQNGRQPDTLAMPEPTYVDALAITMTQTPASQDLAEPDQGPTLIRDSQGRTRPAPAASDGDHQ